MPRLNTLSGQGITQETELRRLLNQCKRHVEQRVAFFVSRNMSLENGQQTATPQSGSVGLVGSRSIGFLDETNVAHEVQIDHNRYG